MAKRAKDEPMSRSPFWKPALVGDSVEGVYSGFQTGQVKNRQTLSMKLARSNGDALVTVSYMIEATIKPVLKKLIKGKTRVKFEYLGKGGRARLYNVWFDGKLLPAQSGFPVASDSEVEAFFNREREEVPKGRK